MANEETTTEEVPNKKGKMGMILALILALVAGIGGFYTTYSGLVLNSVEGEDVPVSEAGKSLKLLGNNVYLPLDPLVVNIRSSSKYRLLKFVGQVEVKPEHAEEIENLKPRLMDVMNTYLNALEAARFEDPIALIKLRAQLLRRLQIISGDGRIEDLLIMEFILQ